jgi:ADP-heptose:LPS heptosyltransferase
VTDLVGKTSIAQLMHTIEHAALLVANDSAALHMAVGFDRPAVALFGPTRTDLVGPYGRGEDVIQHAPALTKNMHKDEGFGAALMQQITVEEVYAACEQRLGAS